MANKAASAKNYRDTWAHDIKTIRKTTEISEELKKALSEDELSLLQKTRSEKAKAEARTKLDSARGTDEYVDVKETKKQAKDLVKKIIELTGKSKEEAEKMVYGKQEKSESKEKMKTPELKSENHKIDKWLSKKEKLAQWWKEEERPAYINGTEMKIKVLKKELAKDAYVREYQDNGKMPSHLVGEQLFNRKAVLNLKLQDRLPTYSQYQEMWFWWENHEDIMDKNFKKWDNCLLFGFRDPNTEKFHNIGLRTDCRLADGTNVELHKDKMHHYNNYPVFGFSLRLLKN